MKSKVDDKSVKKVISKPTKCLHCSLLVVDGVKRKWYCVELFTM